MIGRAEDMDRVDVPGVMIEGYDYSGKATLAKAVAEDLRARGLTVHESHGTFTHEPIVDRLFRQALVDFADISEEEARSRPFPDPDLFRQFDALKAAQLMVDAELARSHSVVEPGTVYVQERYWLTQYAGNVVLSPGEELLTRRWMQQRAPRFTIQIYLTCTGETRRKRCDARGAAAEEHVLNSYLRHNLDGVIEMDRSAVELVRDDPAWTLLYSDELGPQELCDQVVELFTAAYGPPRQNARSPE